MTRHFSILFQGVKNAVKDDLCMWPGASLAVHNSASLLGKIQVSKGIGDQIENRRGEGKFPVNLIRNKYDDFTVYTINDIVFIFLLLIERCSCGQI